MIQASSINSDNIKQCTPVRHLLPAGCVAAPCLDMSVIPHNVRFTIWPYSPYRRGQRRHPERSIRSELPRQRHAAACGGWRVRPQLRCHPHWLLHLPPLRLLLLVRLLLRLLVRGEDAFQHLQQLVHEAALSQPRGCARFAGGISRQLCVRLRHRLQSRLCHKRSKHARPLEAAALRQQQQHEHVHCCIKPCNHLSIRACYIK